MNTKSSRTSPVPAVSGKEQKTFTDVTKAVKYLILNQDKKVRKKGIDILAYPRKFKKSANVLIPATSKLSKPAGERKQYIIDAVERGFGAIIIRAEREGWDRIYARQALACHRRHKGKNEINGPEKDKYRFDFLLDILDWYREFEISPKICDPKDPWRVRAMRFFFPSVWTTLKAVLVTATKIAVALIALAGVLAGAFELSRREHVQTWLTTHFGEKVDDEEKEDIDREDNIKDKLDTISDQLKDLIDFFTLNSESGDEEDPERSTKIGFFEYIYKRIREFFTGWFPDSIAMPGEGNTMVNRFTNFVTGLTSTIWSWISTIFQSLFTQATGQKTG